MGHNIEDNFRVAVLQNTAVQLPYPDPALHLPLGQANLVVQRDLDRSSLLHLC